MDKTPWFQRQFPGGLPPGSLPCIIERLRGTPLRARALVAGIDARALVDRVGTAWSIAMNLGHLGDLEPLWMLRYRDITGGAAEMTAADLTNRATETAGHDAHSADALIDRFDALRAHAVAHLESLPADALERRSRHPRLGQALSVVDLAFFVAEHDDHHLAEITRLLRAQAGREQAV